MIEILKWPLTSLVALFVFFVFFRVPLVGLIQRIRSIKRDGIDTGPIPAQLDVSDPISVDTLKKTFDSPMLLEMEQGIRAELQKRKLETNSPTVEILIRHLAQTQMNATFESLYRTIFGSQIRILREANSSSGVLIENTKSFYCKIVEQNKPVFENHPYSTYIGFMLNQRLLLEDNGYYRATIRGQAFLGWLVRSQLSETKPY